jgi:hypothetical protein
MNRKQKEICKLWDSLAKDYKDKSTEWLLAMTCDAFNNRNRDMIDNDDILEALEARENAR